jgi:hypothetical protein
MCVCCPARRCVIVIAKKSDLSDLHNRAAAVQLSRLVNAITSKSNLSPFFSVIRQNVVPKVIRSARPPLHLYHNAKWVQ